MLKLALPVILAELDWISMGIVDTIIVAPMGPAAIGAVGSGSTMFFAVMVLGMGTLLALDTFVAKSHGAGRLDECHRWLHAGLQLGVVMSVVLVVIGVIGILQIPRAGLHPEVSALLQPYLGALLWSAFAWRNARAPEPLLPLALLREPEVSTATVASFFSFGAFVGLTLIVPVFLQFARGQVLRNEAGAGRGPRLRAAGPGPARGCSAPTAAARRKTAVECIRIEGAADEISGAPNLDIGYRGAAPAVRIAVIGALLGDPASRIPVKQYSEPVGEGV